MSDDLRERLRAMGLHALANDYDDILAMSIKKRWSLEHALTYVVNREEQERARRSIERRQRTSKLGRFKPVADFDWKWPSRINQAAVHDALDLGFMQENKNVVLIGGQGLGKTMLAKNITSHAVQAGYSALFITAADLLLDLEGQESASALQRRLKRYARVAVLCIDEIGYLAYQQRSADLLFQLVSKRYEQRPLILTTNKSFSDWPSIFPGAACATALVDRVVHHADVIHIEGESYRLRESASAAKRPRPRKATATKK
ncbi:MAG: IS21-like element helper ATPase IstB [Polyangiales bacterium]|nr:ATP-binding protein [Polyangiaceae bacterium]